jgi:hypothetical protein
MARHNDRVLRPAAVLLASTLLLTACSGSSSSSPSTGGSSGGGALPVPSGVTLTPQGTALHLGDTATVAWKPSQKKVGVIKVTVTKLVQVPIGAFRSFRLDPATQRSTPYYVFAKVRNVGDTGLSKVPVPLYVVEHDTLLQASQFQARFAPCPSRPFPAGFTSGKKTSVCQVYFVPPHRHLEGVSFRPSQDVDAITWNGPVVKAVRRHQKKKH